MKDNMEMKGSFNINDAIAILVTAGTMAVEEFLKHPIGGVASIFGLLYMFDRWKTQRFEKKIKQQEYERSIRTSEERKERTEE